MADTHTYLTEYPLGLESGSIAEAVLLRAQIKSHPELRVALIKSIKATLHKYELNISDQLLRELVFAAGQELEIGGDHVVV
jgi:hypothetical protein